MNTANQKRKMIQTIKLKSGEESITVHDSAMFGLVVPLKEVTYLLEQAYLYGMNAASESLGPEPYTSYGDAKRVIQAAIKNGTLPPTTLVYENTKK